MAAADRDADRLKLILTVIADIERRLDAISFEAFLDDRDERDLTSYRLSIIGEESSKLSPALKQRHDLPWTGIYGLRNRVAHHYRSINPRLIWHTARHELNDIAAMCRAELERDAE